MDFHNIEEDGGSERTGDSYRLVELPATWKPMFLAQAIPWSVWISISINNVRLLQGETKIIYDHHQNRDQRPPEDLLGPDITICKGRYSLHSKRIVADQKVCYVLSQTSVTISSSRGVSAGTFAPSVARRLRHLFFYAKADFPVSQHALSKIYGRSRNFGCGACCRGAVITCLLLDLHPSTQ